jgi:hypothetical protein
MTVEDFVFSWPDAGWYRRKIPKTKVKGSSNADKPLFFIVL